MRLPEAAQSQIDALSLIHKSALDLAIKFDAQARIANQMTDVDQKAAAQQAVQQAMNDAAKQAATRSILRALYAPDQLRERMTWFWFNHFNVHQYKANLRVLVGDYEDKAIRVHALGHFRDLLEATLRHPAMLRYLDNADNAVGHINENYAREIMELHTMGVGSGYSQKDVEELARVLTGVGIDLKPENPKLKPELQALLIRDGLFEFNPARHDFGDKTFLGRIIKGRGFAEVEEALDILGRHPATARHTAQQIAVYFVGDNPPAGLVDRMTQTFMGTDGNIANVLEAGKPLASAVQEGFRVRDDVYHAITDHMMEASRGAVSPKGFELAARRIGRLMREQFNLGFVDVGGWDTHVNQGAATGYLADRLGELGRGLAGFAEEIGPEWHDTVVVVISEFGRTFRENGNRGTDHGHGSVYWVLGGGIKGQRIVGEQVGVDERHLFQNRDYPVLTDYRSLLGGLFQRMYGLDQNGLQRVFASVKPRDFALV